MKIKRGFTLLEVLLVVAAIGILAGIVIVAVNPAKQLAATRNAQRRSDVAVIANAVYQYYIANGSLPGNIETTNKYICGFGLSCEGMDLSPIIYNDYIPAYPIDPSAPADSTIGYQIVKTSGDSPRITVTAPHAELDEVISVTK